MSNGVGRVIKREHPLVVKDLYIPDSFVKARVYAERAGGKWFMGNANNKAPGCTGRALAPIHNPPFSFSLCPDRSGSEPDDDARFLLGADAEDLFYAGLLRRAQSCPGPPDVGFELFRVGNRCNHRTHGRQGQHVCDYQLIQSKAPFVR